MSAGLRNALSLDAYLASSFEISTELIAGELRPKPMGTRKHVLLAKRLTGMIDPVTLRAWEFHRGMSKAVEVSTSTGAPIAVSLSAMFEAE